MLLIEPKSLECGSSDDELEPDENRRQSPYKLYAVPDNGIRREDHRQNEQRDRDELEEAVPGVLGIRQVRPPLHERATAEQIASLNGDEGGERQHESTERDRDLRRSE